MTGIAAGGLAGRGSIKVGNIMRSRRKQGKVLLRGITQAEPFSNGASRLLMPSAAVRHYARFREENG